jgi:hypothetical protein
MRGREYGGWPGEGRRSNLNGTMETVNEDFVTTVFGKLISHLVELNLLLLYKCGVQAAEAALGILTCRSLEPNSTTSKTAEIYPEIPLHPN